MKHLFLILVSFLFSSPLWAATPIAAYTLKKTTAELSLPEVSSFFQIKAAVNDTINGDWLYLDKDPSIIPWEAGETYPGNEIGFNFIYAGDSFSRFGISGDGQIFLGKEDGIQPFYSENPFANHNVKNLIYASVQKKPNWGLNHIPATIATDNSTKIGYVSKNDTLVIRYENIIASDKEGQTAIMSYSILLTKNGDISIADLSLAEGENFAFCFGLRGFEEYDFITATSWGGTTANDAYYTALPLSTGEHGANTSLRFSVPEKCVKPEAAIITAEYDILLSDRIKAQIQLEGDCDKALVFLSEESNYHVKPIDGTVYKEPSFNSEGDYIGEYEIKSISATPAIEYHNLKSNTQYYIYVYPFNDKCAEGPVYAAEPIIITVKTTEASPVTIVKSIEKNSIVLEFPELEEGKNILIGCSRKSYYAENRIIELSDKVYKVGDTLFYKEEDKFAKIGSFFVEALYSGEIANNTLTINDLLESTSYYFYIWSYDAQNKHSIQYSPIEIKTLSEETAKFEFSTDRIPLTDSDTIMPAGWSREEGNCKFLIRSTASSGGLLSVEPDLTDTEKQKALCVLLQNGGTPQNIIKPTATAITPEIISAYTSIKVNTSLKLAQVGNWGSETPIQFRAETDTLYIEYKKAEEWQEGAIITSENTFEYVDGFATISSIIQVPIKEKIQLRYRLISLGGTFRETYKFYISSVEIEPNFPCAIAKNIQVSDTATTHRAIGLVWEEDNKPAASYIYSIRKKGQVAWSEYKRSQTPLSLLATPLSAKSEYEIKLRAVCGIGDSSFAKVIEASTLYGTPYNYNFTNKTSLASEIKSLVGILVDEGNSELREPMFESGFVLGNDVNVNASQKTIGISSVDNNRWLLLPRICLEDSPAQVELSFHASAYKKAGENTYEAVPTDLEACVFVLLSDDQEMNSSKIIDTLYLRDMDHHKYDRIKIDLSKYTRQINIAYMLYNPNTAVSYNDVFFIMDSIKLDYIGDKPCIEVEEIKQYNLTARSVNLSWIGYSQEYGVIYKEVSATTEDTLFTEKTECVLENLKPGTMYLYKIQAYCGDNHTSASILSEEAFFYTLDTCAKPSDVKVLATSWNSVTVTAKSVSDKLIHIWAKDTDLYPSLDYYLDGWSSSVDTFTISGLQEALNISYMISISSLCTGNDTSAWTSPIEFTTDMPICEKPHSLESEASFNEVKLKWSAGEGNDYFNLFFKEAQRSMFDTTIVSKTQYIIRDLKEETAYVWKVQGVCDQYFVSAFSATENVTTLKKNSLENTELRESIQLISNNDRIIVLNPQSRKIDRVEVYNTMGTSLYKNNFSTAENIILPRLSDDSIVVLVRIFSENQIATYKLLVK